MSEMTKRHKKNEKKLYLDFCCDTRNMCVHLKKAEDLKRKIEILILFLNPI